MADGGGVFIDVNGFRLVRDERGEFVVFIIKIRLGAFAWTVYRRFSQFRSLGERSRQVRSTTSRGLLTLWERRPTTGSVESVRVCRRYSANIGEAADRILRSFCSAATKVASTGSKAMVASPRAYRARR